MPTRWQQRLDQTLRASVRAHPAVPQAILLPPPWSGDKGVGCSLGLLVQTPEQQGEPCVLRVSRSGPRSHSSLLLTSGKFTDKTVLENLSSWLQKWESFYLVGQGPNSAVKASSELLDPSFMLPTHTLHPVE